MLNLIIKNSPFYIWLRWIKNLIMIKFKYPSVSILYNSIVIKSELGKCITLYRNVGVNNCTVGDYTYISDDSSFSNTSIGKFCSIGPGVRCGMGIHPSRAFVSTHPIFFSTSKQAQVSFTDKEYFEELLPIKIGNDVWIGANVTILDGITIGDGAIIGAGAVVNKNVPSYAIMGGVPAKLIRYRFTQEEIDFLLQDKWWNKPEEWLRKNYKMMHDIDKYINYLYLKEKSND